MRQQFVLTIEVESKNGFDTAEFHSFVQTMVQPDPTDPDNEQDIEVLECAEIKMS